MIIFLFMAECINHYLKTLELIWLCTGCLLVQMANVGSHWLQLAVPPSPLVSLQFFAGSSLFSLIAFHHMLWKLFCCGWCVQLPPIHLMYGVHAVIWMHLPCDKLYYVIDFHFFEPFLALLTSNVCGI